MLTKINILGLSHKFVELNDSCSENMYQWSPKLITLCDIFQSNDLEITL